MSTFRKVIYDKVLKKRTDDFELSTKPIKTVKNNYFY
jgi:hypothetical protein